MTPSKISDIAAFLRAKPFTSAGLAAIVLVQVQHLYEWTFRTIHNIVQLKDDVLLASDMLQGATASSLVMALPQTFQAAFLPACLVALALFADAVLAHETGRSLIGHVRAIHRMVRSDYVLA